MNPASDPTAEAHRAAVHWLLHLQRLGVSHLPSIDASVREGAEAALSDAGLITAPAFAIAASPVDQAAPSVRSAPVAHAPSSRTAAPDARPTSPVSPRPTTTPAPAVAATSSLLPVTEVWTEGNLSDALRRQRLDTLQQTVAACRRCEELACRRQSTVFGEGAVRPRVCFFGEGPGADEDRQGRPFVGAAGQLLDKIIQACTWKRHEVYILNTVKCRPPGNRNPTDQEVGNCREYFEAQLEVLQPEYIVCLGLVAAKALFPDALSIGRMRSRFHPYKGARVLVTYHPAYLLRTPSAKAATWEDMKLLMRTMGITPASK